MVTAYTAKILLVGWTNVRCRSSYNYKIMKYCSKICIFKMNGAPSVGTSFLHFLVTATSTTQVGSSQHKMFNNVWVGVIITNYLFFVIYHMRNFRHVCFSTFIPKFKCVFQRTVFIFTSKILKRLMTIVIISKCVYQMSPSNFTKR